MLVTPRGPEELLTPGRGEPVVGVFHVVVGHHGGHRAFSLSSVWRFGGRRTRAIVPPPWTVRGLRASAGPRAAWHTMTARVLTVRSPPSAREWRSTPPGVPPRSHLRSGRLARPAAGPRPPHQRTTENRGVPSSSLGLAIRKAPPAAGPSRLWGLAARGRWWKWTR